MHNRNSPFTTGTTCFGGSTVLGWGSTLAPVESDSSLTFSPFGGSAGGVESGDGGLGGRGGGGESVGGGIPSPPASPVAPTGCCGCSAIASKTRLQNETVHFNRRNVSFSLHILAANNSLLGDTKLSLAGVSRLWPLSSARMRCYVVPRLPGPRIAIALS